MVSAAAPYLEGLYRFSRRWDAGYRYDRLWAPSSGPCLRPRPAAPYRDADPAATASSACSACSTATTPQAHFIDHALMLQYRLSLGAHGA